uniref:BRX domain-containing protein n=1 Tax=Aegilops tauschii subsp. strangulata TaxID=200361 RepID=A0A452ZQW0_AEGTS
MLIVTSLPFNIQLKGLVDKVPAEFSDSIKDLQSQSEKYLTGQCSHSPEAISGHEQPRLPIGGMHEITHHGRSASMVNLDGSSLTSESPCHRFMDSNGRAPGDFAPKYGTHGEVQLIEQFEPGVYVTLIQLRDGTKVFKRVRFRYSIPTPFTVLCIHLNLIFLRMRGIHLNNLFEAFVPHNNPITKL